MTLNPAIVCLYSYRFTNFRRYRLFLLLSFHKGFDFKDGLPLKPDYGVFYHPSYGVMPWGPLSARSQSHAAKPLRPLPKASFSDSPRYRCDAKCESTAHRALFFATSRIYSLFYLFSLSHPYLRYTPSMARGWMEAPCQNRSKDATSVSCRPWSHRSLRCDVGYGFC